MPHIAIENDLPGIGGLMVQHPGSAAPLNHLANVLLRGESKLSRGERELIAAHVSHLNATPFCAGTHGAAAAAQLTDGATVVNAALKDSTDTRLSPRLRALLRIAGEVQEAARPVTEVTIEHARQEGLADSEIHDTVLVAAAFCMYNRYVSCLATDVPSDPDYYRQAGQRLTRDGYGNTPS